MDRYMTENKSELPELTPNQKRKLQQLTIASLAARNKVGPVKN